MTSSQHGKCIQISSLLLLEAIHFYRVFALVLLAPFALSFGVSISQISSLISLAKPHVRWRPRSRQYDSNILKPVPAFALAERTVTILLQELMTVEVLACRLSSSHEEDVVSPKAERIQHGHKGV